MKIINTPNLLTTAFSALLLAGCGSDPVPHDHDGDGKPDHGPEAHGTPVPHDHDGDGKPDHGPEAHAEPAHPTHGVHGGELVEVGEHLLHLEMLHDSAAATLTVYVTGPDGKTPADLSEAPVANLRVAGEPVTVPFEGSGSEWTLTHDAFKGEPQGRVAVKAGGKTWKVEMVHTH